MKPLLTVFLSLLACAAIAQKRVVLDQYYNNEVEAKTGKAFHYIWEDQEMTGFSQLGGLFEAEGAKLATLREKPSKNNLSGTAVYIIADPDTKDESRNPNFLDEEAAKAVFKWVKRGGILLLMTNDSQNADLDHTNILGRKFGMSFEKEIVHAELSEPGKPRNFNSCASTNLPTHPLFDGVSKIFIKGVAPIALSSPAKVVLAENGKTLIAQAKCGKGFVLAVGDPWLYNEYIDNKMLPAEFENFKAAKNLVKLLLNP
ncbi:hypothetical protein [Desertivirga arenae]|uniref:hypothetical protein n=1 Tax=Desertivirga arenae TaxID=2810309 RepID=UPI001A96A7BA|nr:hypothetical protein [Pedobacter sp. SYSU D00823]